MKSANWLLVVHSPWIKQFWGDTSKQEKILRLKNILFSWMHASLRGGFNLLLTKLLINLCCSGRLFLLCRARASCKFKVVCFSEEELAAGSIPKRLIENWLIWPVMVGNINFSLLWRSPQPAFLLGVCQSCLQILLDLGTCPCYWRSATPVIR